MRVVKGRLAVPDLGLQMVMPSVVERDDLPLEYWGHGLRHWRERIDRSPYAN